MVMTSLNHRITILITGMIILVNEELQIIILIEQFTDQDRLFTSKDWWLILMEKRITK